MKFRPIKKKSLLIESIHPLYTIFIKVLKFSINDVFSRKIFGKTKYFLGTGFVWRIPEN
jgi:hypothetical protein